ncbi:T6SS phospholipase effector Tle1-like catalytic domain-containing protein [Chromobacterium vaccinii]|uniref:T6SS phospholipase effector Tle1-like catalytic domain-containing protein n=1 Tax=Chromobacterium vaccinii TaxID=1108595 RepID=UPI000E1A83B2|nr:DUF2235 domain-containing protein [Chromobacterium vaccinii]SUX30514.1 Uncharacterized conserved protein [Chromobacterium vaccinii]
MPVSLAPAYPSDGYFPNEISKVLVQRLMQQKEINESCMEERAAGKPAKCSQVLNISLFFDGTNNHGDSDDDANPVCSSNVRRIYHATIGDAKTVASGYFKHYMQGVGTEFKKIGENGPSSSGLSFATGGERRILWGLTRLIDSLRKAIGVGEFGDQDAMGVIHKMEFTYEQTKNGLKVQKPTNKADRRDAMAEGMAKVLAKLRDKDFTPKVLQINLFIYGFSRGAAEARAFLWRLDEQMQGDAFFGIPLKVKFLGIFDTVASVGLTELAPGAQGHIDWADGTMQLPVRGWLEQCQHMVSAHEQRLCFPLDSTGTTTQGGYPACVKGEWVYPGMHSDVGGGYPPDDQGKARGEQGMLLSQLPLNHMYRLAFDAGAPLKINAGALIKGMPADQARLTMLQKQEPWRFMDEGVMELFRVKPDLQKRFNAWRSASKGAGSLIDIMKEQTAQINAWRIERYAGGLNGEGGQDQQQSDYYKYVKDNRETPKWAVDQQKDAWSRQSGKSNASEVKMTPPKWKVYSPQEERQVDEPIPEDKLTTEDKKYIGKPFTPNLSKEYEPTQDLTQLKAGAKDFREDYLGQRSMELNPVGWLATLFTAFSRPFSADCPSTERDILLKKSQALHKDVVVNAELMALYDEHAHDSRAWFMYYALKKLEPHGSYWRYRTVFFTDDDNNKKLICKAPEEEETGAKELR